MKKIETLVEDIQALLENGVTFSNEDLVKFEQGIGNAVEDSLLNQEHKPGLRMSKFGSPCGRKLWYDEHPDQVQDKESLPASARLKFAYGYMIEGLMITLTKLAGHTVEREQEEVNYCGVPGHIDAIIDGELVDIKSANSRSFDKFKYHRLEQEDPFGYLDQLNLYYRSAGLSTGRFHFLAVDKELGHICLDTYQVDEGRDMEKEVLLKQMMLTDETPPKRLEPAPDGKSGNMQLALPCRYCAYKKTCWPTMRTFLYSTGLRYLTTVVKEPEVREVL